MNWFLECLQKKYSEFDGRAHREEFWMFVAVYLGLDIAINVVGWFLHMRFLGGLFALATFLPSLAVGARRLHDTGRSGWWQLLGCLPVIGQIILIVFLAQPGENGVNKYGPSPLDANPL